MESISYKELKKPEKISCHEFGDLVNYGLPQTDEVCVVIGSGPGKEATEIAREVGCNGYVYGIELTGEYIKDAYNRAQQEGITNVDFMQGNIENLKINSEVAHLVLSDCVFNYNRPEAWKEIFRVLKKGGRFIVSDVYKKPEPESNSHYGENVFSRAAYIEFLYRIGFTSLRIIKENKSTDGITGFIVAGEKPGDRIGATCRL